MNTIDNISQILFNILEKIAEAIPGFLGGLVLMIVGWILAKIVSSSLKKLFVTIKIDNLSDKLNTIDLFKNLNIKLSIFLSKLAFWLIILVFSIAATEIMGLKVISQGIGALLGYTPKLLSAVVFFVVGVFIANIIKEVVFAACSSMAISGGRFISAFVFYFLVIIISISALNQADIDTDILTQNLTLAMGAIFLAFAIGYGFASKDIMANVLASFYSRDKFEIGQVIKIGEVAGEIISMDSTSVTLDAGDKKVILPLQKLLNSTVEVL